MKTLFRYATGLFLAGALTMGMAPFANAQRGFHGGGGGARVGGGIGFGGFHGAVGFRAGSNLAVTARPGYYGGYYGGTYFYGYPTIGFHLGFLPFGYYPFYFGSDLYYYYGGAFYRPYDNGGYEIATPPLGAAVPNLPKGAQSIVIDGVQYYEFNGVYFQPTTDDKGKTVYVVAGRDGVLNTAGENGVTNPPPAPQVGDIVNQLPQGSHKVKLNNKTYFVDTEGIYYEEFTDKNNFKAFRIVSIPADDDNEKQQ